MKTNSDKGNAKNVVSFESLTVLLNDFGDFYNPVNEKLKIPALKSLLVKGKDAITEVQNYFTVYAKAVDAREDAFEPLNKLITRVKNALKACGTTTRTIETAQTFFRKIQGTRAVRKLTEEELKTLADQGKEITQISASQMSYDSRLDNFAQLINILANTQEYTPNEEDLQVAYLNNLYETLRELNTTVMTNDIKLSTARKERNKILYDPDSGLVPIAFMVKTYIKSIYGVSSTQNEQASKIVFKNL